MTCKSVITCFILEIQFRFTWKLAFLPFNHQESTLIQTTFSVCVPHLRLQSSVCDVVPKASEVITSVKQTAEGETSLSALESNCEWWIMVYWYSLGRLSLFHTHSLQLTKSHTFLGKYKYLIIYFRHFPYWATSLTIWSPHACWTCYQWRL